MNVNFQKKNVDVLTELSIALICSKTKKRQVQEKAMEYREHSDEAPEADLQDSEDHACNSEDLGPALAGPLKS